jgi:hypothetical protein
MTRTNLPEQWAREVSNRRCEIRDLAQFVLNSKHGTQFAGKYNNIIPPRIKMQRFASKTCQLDEGVLKALQDCTMVAGFN